MARRVYVKSLQIKENAFRQMPREEKLLPSFDDSRALLPQPFWRGHESAIDCYWKTWQLAFSNLRQPTPENGFTASYIDTAFNDCIFMWDSAFILMFGRYGRRVFDFQRTLDNFYVKQHPDGFICRQIQMPDGEDRWERFDFAGSTGPNILPWCEWEHFREVQDRERLANVFPVLAAYHRWLRMYHTWQDGTYRGTGWFTGMDNQPRVPPEAVQNDWSDAWVHGHMSWIDVCLQQILSCKALVRMAEVLGRGDEAQDFREEADLLTRRINETMWDEKDGFYYDRHRDGSLNGVKSIVSFWALLADMIPPDRLPRFVQHLNHPGEFNRLNRVPSLSADHPKFCADGGYACGGVWPQTTFMVLRGLTAVGEDALAHEIARNHHNCVVKVFEDTGTVWENYAPDSVKPGNPAMADFVGWSGLGPIATFFEYVLGLRPNVPKEKLIWDVRLLEEHGVRQYPFGADGLADLKCEARKSESEKPVVEVRSNVPLEVKVRWEGGMEMLSAKVGM